MNPVNTSCRSFRSQVPPLQEGQLWKIKRRYIYIVASVGASIRFKMLNSPNQRGERTLSSGVDTLSRYLQCRKGKLVFS